MRITIPRLILFILLELLIIIVAKCAIGQEPPTPIGGYGNQVVFTVLKTEGEKKWVLPQAAVWFKLAPLSGPTAKSPLAKDDFLLCQDFTMKDQEGGYHVACRCGEDTYLIEAIGLRPFEEKKKK
jgi:hypothetical protein